MRYAAISEGAVVLDVGTGTGNVALAAARCVGARGRVVGIDLSCAMLNEAGPFASEYELVLVSWLWDRLAPGKA